MTVKPEFLEIVCCPACRSAEFLSVGGSKRRPTLDCGTCGEQYGFVDGIPDLVPRVNNPQDSPYRTDTLFNLMASTYHLSLPLMSMWVWRCPPLRFVDWTHMVLGRAGDGWHLSQPVASGNMLKHCWGEHVEAKVMAVDTAWNMLRRAKKRLEGAKLLDRVHLARVDVHNLPFRNEAFASVLSLNGLHAFPHRESALSELDRVCEVGGMFGGSTLIREQGRMADFVISTYERYGVFPLLRSKNYILSELEALGGEKMLHETYGSVLFFAMEKAAKSA